MMKEDISEQKILEEYITSKDPALREQLILRYVPLVRFVVGRLGLSKYRSENYEDIESQGLLGLIEAVDNYNPDFGTQLSTYATLKIRSKILDYLRGLDWLPRTARERVKTVQGAIEELSIKLQRDPTDEELGEHLNMDSAILQKALVDSSRVVISLDRDDRNENQADEAAPIYEKLEDEKQVNPSDRYEDKDTLKWMVNVIKGLKEREQQVLSLYYFNELTFREIGEVLGVSESRICQIHGKALLNVRNEFEKTKI